jgi:hypothetical protein
MREHIQIGGEIIKLKNITINEALLLAKEIADNINSKTNKTMKKSSKRTSNEKKTRKQKKRT